MPLKVLMFGWEFPPFNTGGLGVACRGIVTHLPENTETILVLPTAPEEDYDSVRFLDINNDDKKINTRNVSTTLEGYITSSKYSQKFNKLLIDKPLKSDIYGRDLFEEVERYARKAGEIAKKVDFDVIHAHDWLTFGAGIHAKNVTGKPLVVHVHATEFDRGAGHGINDFVYDKERSGMQKADKIISVSERTKNILVDEYDIDPTKIRVVYNGIDKSRFNTNVNDLNLKNKKVVLFLGRITMQKYPMGFLEAARAVLEEVDDVLFIMAGTGDMQRQVMEKAANLGIGDKVLFPGFVQGDQLSRLYKTSDLFVMPSVSEPFGLTALEAMVHDTPTLVSKQSGVSEFINHTLKTDFWDINDMADKIVSVLKRSPLKNTLQKELKEEVKDISWNRTAKRCSEIYHELIN